MRLQIDTRLDYQFATPTDVLLALEVLPGGDQTLIEDLLTVDGSGPLTPISGEETLGRRTWLRAQGALTIHYRATVDIQRSAESFDRLVADPLPLLPSHALAHLFPSRYCEADRFVAFVTREFSDLDGGAKIAAMADWIHDHVEYCIGASDTATSACDTFIRRQGVCRDFAHLLIAFARAVGIPARMVSAYAWALAPPDFHAVVEVWLSGAWHLIDATQLVPIDGIVRIAVGRDATDISFMTIFGTAELWSQTVSVVQLTP